MTSEKNKKEWYFFCNINFWFTCISSVGLPIFAENFPLGNIISVISLNFPGFQTRSNCFELKSLMKHRSTESNSPKKLESIIRFSKSIKLRVGYVNKVELTEGKFKWNKIKLSNSELLMESIVNTLIQCESSQGNFNSHFFYYFHIRS